MVDRYLAYLQDECIDHALFQKMNALHSNTVYPLTAAMMIEYESIDSIVNNLMNKTELQFRQLHTAYVKRSSTYKRVCLTLIY